MELEIEHKYLLKNFPDQYWDEILEIEQFYYPVGDDWERIRETSTQEDTKYVHCKKTRQESVKGGPVVYEEEERFLSFEEFVSLKEKCLYEIRKTRYVIAEGKLKWEIDVYKDFHLIIAEIEIPDVNYQFKIPEYIASNLIMEVTEFREFTNRSLSSPIIP